MDFSNLHERSYAPSSEQCDAIRKRGGTKEEILKFIQTDLMDDKNCFVLFVNPMMAAFWAKDPKEMQSRLEVSRINLIEKLEYKAVAPELPEIAREDIKKYLEKTKLQKWDKEKSEEAWKEFEILLKRVNESIEIELN